MDRGSRCFYPRLTVGIVIRVTFSRNYLEKFFPMTRDDALNTLRNRGWLTRTPADFADRLLAGATLRRREPGETLCILDDPSIRLFGVAEGLASVFIDADPTAVRLGFVASAGWWGGTVGAADARPRRATVIARTPVTVLNVPLAHVEALAREDPETWRYIAINVANHFDNLGLLLMAHLHDDIGVRIMITLRRLHVFNNNQTEFSISQGELAEMAGLSRNSANRAIGQMVAAGVIETGYGRIRITCPEALATALARAAK